MQTHTKGLDMQNYKPEPAKQQKPILMNGQRLSWGELSALFISRKAQLQAEVSA